MTEELMNFDRYSRRFWEQLLTDHQTPLTELELESIKSLNDQIKISDVTDVYLPLINLIKIYRRSLEDLHFSKDLFFKHPNKKVPFIIGVSGSVAVGKSTTSRLLQLLLSRIFQTDSVELVTTDGFLYPNKHLIEQDILNRKGFPESYNMELLLDFLHRMKSGLDCEIPIYSHEIYDIVSGQKQLITAPDILIVEGINVFQTPQNNNLYLTDFYDFSIYIDADTDDIETWYLERFKRLLEIAKNDSNNYYHRFLAFSEEERVLVAKNTWKTINLINLENYIAPTKSQADVILHKDKTHKISEILVKR